MTMMYDVLFAPTKSAPGPILATFTVRAAADALVDLLNAQNKAGHIADATGFTAFVREAQRDMSVWDLTEDQVRDWLPSITSAARLRTMYAREQENPDFAPMGRIGVRNAIEERLGEVALEDERVHAEGVAKAEQAAAAAEAREAEKAAKAAAEAAEDAEASVLDEPEDDEPADVE